MITYTLRNALSKGRFALNIKKRLLAAGTVLMLTPLHASAQFALKTNLLYDATTTPNLGAELVLSRKSTVNLVYGLNPWKFSSKKHGQRYAKHWVVMPEYRWWTCSALDGHFIGVHAMGGQFNAQNVDLPIPGGFFGGDRHSRNIAKEVRDSRYEGTYAGVGFTYGYQWPLSKHWNIEAEAGVGYNHIWYKQFNCGTCGAKRVKSETNYAGLTKLGLSIMYIF